MGKLILKELVNYVGNIGKKAEYNVRLFSKKEELIFPVIIKDFRYTSMVCIEYQVAPISGRGLSWVDERYITIVEKERIEK